MTDYIPLKNQKNVIEPQKFGNRTFTIPSGFKIYGLVSEGDFGINAKIKDEKSNLWYSLKKFFDLFNHSVDYQKKVVKEIFISHHLRKQPFFLQIYAILPLSPNFKDVYWISELLENDLRLLVNSPSKIDRSIVKKILIEILVGIGTLHKNGIIHRDLKPSNILIDSNYDIRITDFGFALGFTPNTETNDIQNTSYATTRFYHSPEFLLMYEKINEKTDIWSIGCIFGELLKTKNVIFPGINHIDQIEKIIEKLGTPDYKEIKACDPAKRFLAILPKSNKKDWRNYYPGEDELAVDLLNKMLKFDPDDRISVIDALNHPYLQADFEKMKNEKKFENFLGGNPKPFSFIPLTKLENSYQLKDALIHLANCSEKS